LLSMAAASLMASEAESGAQATHSTTWSWSRNSTLNHHKVLTSVADTDPNPDPDPSDPYVLGRLNPNLLVRGLDPESDPDLSITNQKQ
jgi:hypothetical protein